MPRNRAGQLLLAACIQVLVACSGTRVDTATKAERADSPAKILHFYTGAPVIARGDKALLCYGVDNAASVSLEPPVDRVWPAFNRCFDVRPAATTTYVLTATGKDGSTTSEKVEVRVSGEVARSEPASAPTAAGPAITSFTVRSSSADSATLCFATSGATEVAVDPPAMPPSKSPMGCFVVARQKGNTYTLTARDASGRSATKTLNLQTTRQ